MGGNVNGDSGRLCAGGRLVTTVVSVSAVLTAPGLAPTARATVPLHFMSQATWLVSPGGMPALGLVWTSLSTGSAFGENAVWQKYFCRRGEFCAVGDINGDGRADIILFKSHAVAGVEHGNVLWASASGSGFGAPQYAHGYFCVDDESCYVGDVNGDGRADGLTLKAHYNSPFEA